jgi:hypothetical protein
MINNDVENKLLDWRRAASRQCHEVSASEQQQEAQQGSNNSSCGAPDGIKARVVIEAANR